MKLMRLTLLDRFLEKPEKNSSFQKRTEPTEAGNYICRFTSIWFSDFPSQSPHHLSLIYSYIFMLSQIFINSTNIQFSSVSQSCPTLCDPMNCSLPGLPVHHHLPESPRPMSIESVMPSNHLILCRPLLLLPSIFPSIRIFSNESALHIRWPKYWSFSFSISPSNEYSGLISFTMDWLDLLEIQGTLKNLLQRHSSKASILRRSAFFMVQISHSYMTTGKAIALTIQTFVGKVMSLLFNTLGLS